MTPADTPGPTASTPLRPDVVVFDVIETLAALDAVQDRLREVGLGAEALPRWFLRILRDGAMLTLAGGFASFPDVAASALHTETRGALTDDQVRHVVAGFREVVPQPDAVAAVRAACEAGLRVVLLSNGPEASTRAFAERAGISGHVDHVLSIDDVRAWKPARAVYDSAVRAAGVPPERMAMVAVHSWDVYGAHCAGFTTGWTPRLEGAPVPAFGRADVVADRLDGVIAGLAALPHG